MQGALHGELQETIWKQVYTEANEILKQNNYLVTDLFDTDKWREYSSKNVTLTSMEPAV